MSNEIDALCERLEKRSKTYSWDSTTYYATDADMMRQAATALRQLQAENERLHTLAKANNDLARHEASGRRELQSENAALKARVEALDRHVQWLVPALHVLRGMCRTVGLKPGAAKADEMIRETEALNLEA